MPIFSLKCFRTDTQVARNRVRGFGLLKPHTVPARIVSPLSVACSTLSAFQVESVEQPWVKRQLWGGEFWTDGYFASTVGRHGNEAMISDSVKKQGRDYQKLHENRQLALF